MIETVIFLFVILLCPFTMGCWLAFGASCLYTFVHTRLGYGVLHLFLTLTPISLFVATRIFFGVAVCTNCGSISDNIYNPENGISTVDVCNRCVVYIGCDQYQHIVQNPPTPQVCLSCSGSIEMNDDEFDELLVLFCSFIAVVGYYIMLTVLGLYSLNERKRASSRAKSR